MTKKIGIYMLIIVVILNGCAKRLAVNYSEVEETNYVYARLNSGKTVSGSVEKAEPHQMTLLDKSKNVRVLPKSTITDITRKPPVYDDFGKGISELEIKQFQNSNYTLVYGIGGGLLSVGASFFVGSLVGKNSTAVLAGTTAGGGILGTVLFTTAGKARDRNAAIEKIKAERRTRQIRLESVKEERSDEQIRKLLEEEKQKQNKLREEREELLKELQKKKK